MELVVGELTKFRVPHRRGQGQSTSLFPVTNCIPLWSDWSHSHRSSLHRSSSSLPGIGQLRPPLANSAWPGHPGSISTRSPPLVEAPAARASPAPWSYPCHRRASPLVQLGRSPPLPSTVILKLGGEEYRWVDHRSNLSVLLALFT